MTLCTVLVVLLSSRIRVNIQRVSKCRQRLTLVVAAIRYDTLARVSYDYAAALTSQKTGSLCYL